MTIKKVFRVIGKVLLWVLYLMISGKERQKYQHAKHRGREVLDVENDLFGSTYAMGKRLKENEEPQRDFLTWKEFRKLHEF